MSRENIEIDEEEIDIKDIFRTILRYKWIIILLSILFTFFSAYYAYFQPNIYKVSGTVEVGLDKRGYGGSQDVLAMAMESGRRIRHFA